MGGPASSGERGHELARPRLKAEAELKGTALVPGAKKLNSDIGRLTLFNSTLSGFVARGWPGAMIIILESASGRSGTRAARDPCPCHEQAGPPAVVVAAECISSVARQSIFAGGEGEVGGSERERAVGARPSV